MLILDWRERVAAVEIATDVCAANEDARSDNVCRYFTYRRMQGQGRQRRDDAAECMEMLVGVFPYQSSAAATSRQHTEVSGKLPS
jgi:hypothetical protein